MNKLIPLCLLTMSLYVSPAQADEATTYNTTWKFTMIYDGSKTTFDPASDKDVVMPPGSSWSCHKNTVAIIDGFSDGSFSCHAPDVGIRIGAMCKPDQPYTDTTYASISSVNVKTTTFIVQCETHQTTKA